jgi:hypothetical protein
MWKEISSPRIPKLPLNTILSPHHLLLILIVHLHKIPFHLFLPSPWSISGRFPKYLPTRLLYVFLVATCQFYNSLLDFTILITLYKSDIPHYMLSKIVLSCHPLYIQIFSTALCFKTLVIYVVPLRNHILQLYKTRGKVTFPHALFLIVGNWKLDRMMTDTELNNQHLMNFLFSSWTSFLSLLYPITFSLFLKFL